MYFNMEHCHVCKEVTGHYNGECGKCLDKKVKERIRMWEAQDIETKLTNLRERIEKLEQGPARYGNPVLGGMKDG